MALILALDSSTSGCSVALFSGSTLVATEASFQEKSAAEIFTTLIAEVIKKANHAMTDIEAIAIAKGPGSYTGLRIAVSTAKGLAFGLGVPLISFGTLALMCYQVSPIIEIDLLCPMIDARRMEVFCGFFDAKTKLQSIETQAIIVDENAFSEILANRKILFFGEGSKKCAEVLKHENAFFLEEKILPNVAYIGQLINEKYEEKDFEDLVKFEPYYLKEYMFKTKKS